MRRGRLLFALACLAALLVTVASELDIGGADAAAGGVLVAEPSFGAPAETFLGASPGEAEGEVWATETEAGTLVHYTDAGGWETVAAPVDAEGGTPEVRFGPRKGPAIGRTTAAGGVVVVGRESASEEPVLVVRDPSGALRIAAPPGEEVLEGETYLGETPLVAALEAGPQTRALVTHAGAPAPLAVASLAGGNWTREPICVGFAAGPACEAPSDRFRAIDVEASEGEAWLLGREAAPGEGIELFRREPNGGEGGKAVWRQQRLGPANSLGARYAAAEAGGAAIAARAVGQPLTVTSAGVWVDATLTEGTTEAEATIYYDIGKGQVTGSWCDLSASGLCTYPLGLKLATGPGRSFAWPSKGAGEPFGTRVLTGVEEGSIVSLVGTEFQRNPLVGGDAGADFGAALSSPEEGWLGADPPVRLTHEPQESSLRSWPVPFRRPLTAIVAAPEGTAGALTTEALAVGAAGEVARYRSGLGWEPEFLLTSSGKRATPNLRGVAWPEPGRAFAVGDAGAMWVWQKATGLWSPDPAEPPELIRANFTGIAFDPSLPSRGYAVGKQGVLLRYGRTWTQEALPAGVPEEANFTSIAFAGETAYATWKYPVEASPTTVTYTGGVIVNEGSGWAVESAATEALDLGVPRGEVPQRVAGLADGGVAIAGLAGKVVTREAPGASWQTAPGGKVGYPVALAAVREGGRVRTLISVAGRERAETADATTDSEQVFDQPPVGQPPLFTEPYPLPYQGYLLRQTASGWRDEQHQVFPLPEHEEGRTAYDLPARPDPVLAILVNPQSAEGWVVGGETGGQLETGGEEIQTADVFRYGPAATPPSNFSSVPIAAGSNAEFAIGGDAQCAGPCADLTGTGIGPDRSLRAAVGKAATIPGLRGFLYTGPGVAAGGFNFGERLGATLSPAAFAREERAYALRLGSAAGNLPTFAAPAETDLDASASLGTFEEAFSGFQAPLGQAAPGAGITPTSAAGPGQGYYSFVSSGTGGSVRVIVLDYSLPTLGEAQQCWLANQLSAAGESGTPAIVVGGRDLAHLAPNAAEDSAQVLPILVSGTFPAGCAASGKPAGASAYFFDFPEQNRQYSLTSGGRSIPAFGSGTLGYVAPPKKRETDFVGAGGFLVASVDVAGRDAATNVAPVGVRLIPNIGSLALNALDGLELRRSRTALFEALARRPEAGSECIGNKAPESCDALQPDPYVPIPNECKGARCSTGVFPEYTFTSSRPDVAGFVEQDPASLNPRNPLLVNDKPVADAQSGLLCAYNAGTTTVTVTAGGFSYSQNVTVLAGTVQQPCGTVPLSGRTTKAAAEPTPVLPPTPVSSNPSPTPSPTPPPPPPVPVVPAPTPTPAPPPVPHLVHPQPAPPLPPSFVPIQPSPTPVVPIVPPPPVPAFQPTPPSGTSPVSAVEREEEEEEAFESSQAAVVVRPHRAMTAVSPLYVEGGGGGVPRLMPALALLAAIGAVSLAGDRMGRRHRRRSGRRHRPAYQSNANSWRYR